MRTRWVYTGKMDRLKRLEFSTRRSLLGFLLQCVGLHITVQDMTLLTSMLAKLKVIVVAIQIPICV
jgi:hypothetical protein